MTITKDPTPYKVIMRSFPRFPYIGLVWALSKTAACRKFANHLNKMGYSKTKTTPAAYTTIEIGNKEALKLKYPIILNRPKLNGSKEK